MHLKKLNETIEEYKNLHQLYQEDPLVIKKFESRLIDILEGK